MVDGTLRFLILFARPKVRDKRERKGVCINATKKQLISNRINGIDYFPFFSLHAIENHVLFQFSSRLLPKMIYFLNNANI